MASFNFLTNTKVYLLHNASRYALEVESISGSQTLTENSYSVKTLHSADMFEATTITKANPANFEFTIHLIREDDHSVVFDRLIDYGEFDLYIEGDEHVFRLESCVITNGSVSINRNSILKVQIAGEASRLHTPEQSSSYSYPGTLQVRNPNTTFNQISDLTLELDSTNYSTHVQSLSFELQNELEWTPYTNVHDGIAATDVDSIMYPTEYTIQKRTLSGVIRRFLPNGAASNVQNFSTSSSLLVKAGQTISGTHYGITLNLDSVSWTNRAVFEEVFIEDYSWRMNYNPTLSTVLQYNTY